MSEVNRFDRSKEIFFGHVCDVQIRVNDFDFYKHINFTNHASFVEYARSEYFRTVLNVDWWDELCVIVKRADIVYEVPILFEDNVSVASKVSKLGSSSIEMIHHIMSSSDFDKVFATAVTTLVCYDYSKNSKMNVPNVWKEKILEHEGYDLKK